MTTTLTTQTPSLHRHLMAPYIILLRQCPCWSLTPNTAAPSAPVFVAHAVRPLSRLRRPSRPIHPKLRTSGLLRRSGAHHVSPIPPPYINRNSQAPTIRELATIPPLLHKLMMPGTRTAPHSMPESHRATTISPLTSTSRQRPCFTLIKSTYHVPLLIVDFHFHYLLSAYIQ